MFADPIPEILSAFRDYVIQLAKISPSGDQALSRACTVCSGVAAQAATVARGKPAVIATNNPCGILAGTCYRANLTNKLIWLVGAVVIAMFILGYVDVR
jgi:hypothetical protein